MVIIIAILTSLNNSNNNSFSNMVISLRLLCCRLRKRKRCYSNSINNSNKIVRCLRYINNSNLNNNKNSNNIGIIYSCRGRIVRNCFSRRAILFMAAI